MFNSKAKAAALGLVMGFMAIVPQAQAYSIFSPQVKKHHKSIFSVSNSGHSVLPPFAYIQFCVHHRSACKNTRGHLAMAGSNTVKLTKRLSKQLAHVNSRVNSRMIARADGSSDKWNVGGRYGDCEDFAMTKRAMLIAAGWPSSALSLTTVKTAWGEGHAILSVHTSGGTLVLDNLSHAVKSIKNVPYRLVSMQGSSAFNWRMPY
jgi:predicted transglutaminase-like cysteine proteinase